MSIPNEIKIQLNTNIPGFQSIDYKPKMTIPDTKEKIVCFDPLIKLNKGLIEKKIPENIRVKEFFNQGLFDSMLNTHGFFTEKTLEKATNEGIIDNNILVTLNFLFPQKGEFYLNKKKYIIADLKWSKGDWKISVKPKMVLDSDKVTNPYLYSKLISEELISGEEQLKQLDDNIVYGPAFKGQRNPDARGVEGSELITSVTPALPAPPSVTPPPAVTPSPAVTPPVRPALPAPPVRPALPAPPVTPALPAPPVTPALPAPPVTPALPAPPNPLVIATCPPMSLDTVPLETNDSDVVQDSGPDPDQETAVEILPDIPSPPVDLTISRRSTSDFKNIIKSISFKSVLQNLYQNLENSFKTILRRNLLKSTSVEVRPGTRDISRIAYNQLADGLRIYRNRGGGDCFFIAVCDGINSNNHLFPDNKIVKGSMGVGNNIFTVQYLRRLVYKYISESLGLQTINNLLTNMVPSNIDILNNTFEAHIKGIERATGADIPPEQYIENVNNIYISKDNFLVGKVDSVPIDISDYYKPYYIIRENEIENYILSSSYWANNVAINALSLELGLNIIPITKISVNGIDILRIPYSNLTEEPLLNSWNKYMFVFNTPGHFELMGFIYKNKITRHQRTVISKRMTIFDRYSTSGLYTSPIYMLLIIYGSYYYYQSEEVKQKFTLYPMIFERLYLSQTNIMNSSDEVKKAQFETNFYKYFPNPNNIQNGGKIINYQRGGNLQLKSNDDSSKKSDICYRITIYLQLIEHKEGKEISPAELKSMKCKSQLNSVYQSYADMTGQKYIPPPDYTS